MNDGCRLPRASDGAPRFAAGPRSVRRLRWLTGAAALAAVALSTGCATRPFGPRAVTPARLGYNEAIARSADEQLLLNIVRLRYRDNPVFLDVASVLAQFGRNASANASLRLASPGGVHEGSAGLSATMSENPVITLSPLRGEEFARRMMAPISGNELVALAFSGWSIERLLLCCVQELHGHRNAISASGPTPELAPEFEEFQRTARALRHFQSSEMLSLRLDEGGGVVLDFETFGSDIDPGQLDALREIFDVPPDAMKLRLVAPTEKPESGSVPFIGRSLLGVLYFLSQAVEVPTEHEARGWVTVTRNRDGSRFDWSRVLGSVFRVQSGAEPPAEGALRVRYRGTWFWIPDDDLDSKSTLSLVTLLLTLKSGDPKGGTPLIAISN